MQEETVSGGKELAGEERLWRNGNFTVFWLGQTLSVFGDAFAMLAMPLLVLEATGSLNQMGLVTAAMGAGQVVAGICVGWLADYGDRRHLMILCDLLRTLLYASIPLVWLLSGAQIWLIYVVAILGACLGMVFQAAFGAIVTKLVAREQIAAANGRLQGSFSLVEVAGPALAGIVVALFHASAAFGVDAGTFLISGLTLWLIRLAPEKAQESQQRAFWRGRFKRRARTSQTADISTSKQLATDPPGARSKLLPTALEGVRFLWETPILRALTCLLFLINIMNAGLVDILIYRVTNDLAQSDSVVGLILGGGCLGGVLAGMVGPSLRKRLGFGPCWIGGFVLYFLAITLMGLSGNLLLIALLACVLTFTMTTAAICTITLRQQITPDHLLGRVTASYLAIVTTLIPLGAVLFTQLASHLGTTPTMEGMGIGGMALAAFAILTPIRQRHPEHARGGIKP